MSKSGQHLYKHGLFAGWTEYRNGGSKKVTLAGSSSPAARPILKREARQAVLKQALEVMRNWTSTPFENEGAAKAGLRVGFVLQGNGWRRSDMQATEIVEEALRIVGARRPSWEEAQPGHALTGDYCSWCHAPINEEDRSRGRRFCSPHCARVAVERMARKTTHHYGAILRSAIRILDQEKAAPQTCEYCAMSFKADRAQRFCSISCKASHQQGDRVIHPRPCDHCRSVFKPWTHQQRYCSQSCSRRAILKVEAEGLAGVRLECACCGTSFQPRTRSAKYCSERCTKRASNRAFNERNRASPPPTAHCAWCGDEYQPKIKLRHEEVGCCSKRCSKDRHRFTSGDTARWLTRRVFDHYIAMPVDQVHRRRLTPQKVDWFFMEMGCGITGEAMMPARSLSCEAA